MHRVVDDAGLHYKAVHYDHGNGLAVADIDGDGLSDIYFVNQAGPSELWKNLGGGRFQDVTSEAGVARHPTGPLHQDYRLNFNTRYVSGGEVPLFRFRYSGASGRQGSCAFDVVVNGNEIRHVDALSGLAVDCAERLAVYFERRWANKEVRSEIDER